MHNSSNVKKLLVRQSGSQRFLNAAGRWTRKAESAFNFPNPLNAIHTCLAQGINDVELVLRFEGDANDRSYRLNCV